MPRVLCHCSKRVFLLTITQYYVFLPNIDNFHPSVFSDYFLHLYCYIKNVLGQYVLRLSLSFFRIEVGCLQRASNHVLYLMNGVAFFDSINYNRAQVLNIPVLLLDCRQDWTSNLPMIVSWMLWETMPITVTLWIYVVNIGIKMKTIVRKPEMIKKTSTFKTTNLDNFYIIRWFQVFLSDTYTLYTMLWYQQISSIQ